MQALAVTGRALALPSVTALQTSNFDTTKLKAHVSDEVQDHSLYGYAHVVAITGEDVRFLSLLNVNGAASCVKCESYSALAP